MGGAGGAESAVCAECSRIVNLTTFIILFERIKHKLDLVARTVQLNSK